MPAYSRRKTPVGDVCIAEKMGAITGLAFGRSLPEIEERETLLIKEAFDQLDAYFAGRLKRFDLPLNPAGTEFQKIVWAELTKIPYGETRSYRDIAQAVGRPKGYRAVGMANHCNPVAIIIPCHRVIGTGGNLVGYAGGLDVKRTLLGLESPSFKF